MVLRDRQGDKVDDLPTLLRPQIYLPPPLLSREVQTMIAPSAKPVKQPCSPRTAAHGTLGFEALVPLAAAPAVNGLCYHPIAKTGTHAVDGICNSFNDRGPGVPNVR